MLSIAIGTTFLISAAVLVLRPSVTRWLSDHTNALRERQALEAGDDEAREKYEWQVRALQISLPILIALIGVGWIVFSLG